MDKLNDLLKEYSQDITVEDLDSLKVLRGFIKWLVENDKINRWRVKNNQDYAEYLGNLPLEEYGTEVLLMLLSIADEPIDYLCNLLFKFN